MYRKIYAKDYRNVYVVGDIHGCYDLLNNALSELKFDKEQDLLISVGDIIDRGDKNLECLRLVKEKWFAMVRGNHEDMAIQGLFEGETVEDRQEHLSEWGFNGGAWYFYGTDEERKEAFFLLDMIKDQPFIIEVEKPNGEIAVIAHAAYPDIEYSFGKEVDKNKVLWDRKILKSNSEHIILGAVDFYFGHTPSKFGCKLGNRHYIDVGSFCLDQLMFVNLTDNTTYLHKEGDIDWYI